MNQLSTYDRIQALVRSPRYLRALKKLKSTSGMTRVEAEEKFCRKFKLTMVVTEEFAQKYSREQLGDAMIFVDADPIVTVKPAGSFEPVNRYIKVRGKREIVRIADPCTHILRDGRFLSLEIDLKRKSEDIEKRMTKWVRLYKKIVDDDVSHAKEGEYDPWEIYDLHTKRGLSLAEIARRKSGIQGSPNYDVVLRAYDRRVRHTYKKACQMIETVK
ncbi:MAG: hypothetical protein A4E69_01461 [Syntrophus sp. PtaB.Bin138]|nr:MAG: hypothetical protein A4E69_01461 [Syntrophus sp. PtaB.Bin138]